MPAPPRLDGRSRRPLRRLWTAFSALLALVATPWPLTGAQAPHYLLPVADIERRLAHEPFQIAGLVDNRWEDDRTQRGALRFRDGVVLPVKWARSAEGGSTLNNQPAYELAAYRLQDLYLDPEDRVVPPTALRVIPLRVYRQLEPGIAPTFEGTRSVLVVLQYWLDHVEAFERPDPGRLAEDAYARRLAELNVLTFLIRHADSNTGNVLIATTGEPRMFAVDNGVAFTSPESPRGTYWKDLHVTRLPAGAVARLRRVDRTMLESAVGVVAQLRVGDDGRLVATEPTARRRPHLAVDFADGVVQIGLTDREIDGVWDRLRDLLRRVDAGEITTY